MADSCHCLGTLATRRQRSARTPHETRRVGPRPGVVRLLPVVAVLLTLAGVGEMVGYATGSGRAMHKLSAEEFHRERFRIELWPRRAAAALKILRTAPER